MDLGNFSEVLANNHPPVLLAEELRQLAIIHNSFSFARVLITGSAGYGKTALLHTFFDSINQTSRIYWLESIYWKEDLEKIKFSESNINEITLVVDNIDEIQNPIEFFSSITPFSKVYFTSRKNDWDYCFTHIISLPGLSTEKCQLILKRYLSDKNLAIEITDSLSDVLSNLSVRDILHISNEYLSKHNLLREWLITVGDKFTQVFRSGEGLYLQSPELFVTRSNEVKIPEPIITDLSIVNQSLLLQVSKTPSMIHQCSPRQFEELVCEILEKKGYKVHLTNQTKDGGKDIIIAESSFLGSFLIYVECKKNAPNRPVGVKFVRELYGTINADRATAGLIITSSYFSKAAKEFVEPIKHQMSLVDYVQLISEIQKIFKDNETMKWPS